MVCHDLVWGPRESWSPERRLIRGGRGSLPANSSGSQATGRKCRTLGTSHGFRPHRSSHVRDALVLEDHTCPCEACSSESVASVVRPFRLRRHCGAPPQLRGRTSSSRAPMRRSRPSPEASPRTACSKLEIGPETLASTTWAAQAWLGGGVDRRSAQAMRCGGPCGVGEAGGRP